MFIDTIFCSCRKAKNRKICMENERKEKLNKRPKVGGIGGLRFSGLEVKKCVENYKPTLAYK